MRISTDDLFSLFALKRLCYIWLLELSFPITVYLVYNFVYLFFSNLSFKKRVWKEFPNSCFAGIRRQNNNRNYSFFFNIYKFPYKKATFRSYAIKNVYFTFKFSLAKWGRRGMLKVVVQRCSVKKVFLEISQNSQ